MRANAMKPVVALAAALLVFAAAPAAYSQGCVLCYTTASATSKAAQRSLDVGILALLIPALVLFLTVMFMLYRRAVSATA